MKSIMHDLLDYFYENYKIQLDLSFQNSFK